jgi:hypothetical protein
MTSSQKTLLLGCLLGVAGSGGVLLFARHQEYLRRYYGDQPRQLAVSAIQGQPVDGPRWVELCNLQVGPRAVFREQAGPFWIPVFPRQGEKTIQAVLRSDKSRSLEEFGLRLRDRATFRGELLDARQAEKARALLSTSYPGQPIAANIWAVDIDFGGPRLWGWPVSSRSTAGGLLVFGVICMLGFVGSCFVRQDPAASFNSVPDLRY